MSSSRTPPMRNKASPLRLAAWPKLFKNDWAFAGSSSSNASFMERLYNPASGAGKWLDTKDPNHHRDFWSLWASGRATGPRVFFRLPAAAQGLVNGDQRSGASGLALGELILRLEQHAFGVQHG